jgi:integrase
MRGMGRIFRRGTVWWVAYSHQGQEYRESARSEKEADAKRLLQQRLGEVGGDRLINRRLVFDDLVAEYLQDHALRSKRSLEWAEDRVANLRRFFGGVKVAEITTGRLKSYQQARLEDGAAAATINRDLGALGRMFTLAVQSGRLGRRPHVPKLLEAPPRSGFVSHRQYLAIREHLISDYQDVLDFGYYTGWRKGEVTSLEWRDVEGEVIRLRPEVSKTRNGRVLVLSAPLEAVIARRRGVQQPECPLVFHYRGRRVLDWRKAWHRACREAGCQGTLFHDLRRTVVRNLTRAGVPERVAMSMTGHKTRSVFDRYNIVSESDLAEASARLAAWNGSDSSRTPTG